MSNVVRFSQWNGSDDPCFDVSDVIGEICDALELRSRRKGVQFEIDSPPYTMLHGEREPFRAVLQLLVVQAMEVTPQGGTLVITSFEDPHGVEVEVADSGPGIAQLFAEHQTEFDAGLAEQKKARGVADLYRLVAALGGEIQVQDCREGGAAITVHFPQYLQRAAA